MCSTLLKIQTLMLPDHLPMFHKTTKIGAVYENKFHADVTDSPGVFAAAIEVVLFAVGAVTDIQVVIATVIVNTTMSSLLSPSSR